MNNDELLAYVRGQCRVRLYRDRDTIGNARGTFAVHDGGPLISIATKRLTPQKLAETTIHEYAHYLQWADGFMDYVDNICDAYEISERFFSGKADLSEAEIHMARNAMLTIEYDAERRAHKMIKELGLKTIDEKFFLKGAEAYVDAIKWKFSRGRDTDSAAPRRLYRGRLLTNKQLYSDLPPKRLRQLDKVFLKQKVPV